MPKKCSSSFYILVPSMLFKTFTGANHILGNKNCDFRPCYSWKRTKLPPINGRRIYGGCIPLYEYFLFPTSFLKIRKRFFASVIKIILGTHGKMSFQMSGREFPRHPKGRDVHPHKSKGVFSDILVRESRLNTLYGLET